MTAMTAMTLRTASKKARWAIAITALGLAGVLLATCDARPSLWKTPNMNPLSPRLQAAMATAKPYCFGRFIIDLPEGATIAWGGNSVPLDVEVAPGRAGELKDTIAQTEAKLKSEPRYPLTEKLNLYIETVNGVLPGMRHVVSHRNFGSMGLRRINTYFAMGDALVVLHALPLDTRVEVAIKRLNDIASRLRPRDNYEVPTDPGQCIENAFLSERPNADQENVADFMNVGFRLKQFPDVHLSISIRAASDDPRSSPSLEDQLRSTEADARAAGEASPFSRVFSLRRGPREIHDWKDGSEFLVRLPFSAEAPHGAHDFWMRFTGKKNKLYHPWVEVKMDTGVADNQSVRVKPSLTDDEAVALWNALTNTIRVRPVTAAKTSNADSAQEPLGTLAATGRTCPQTGVWRCIDEGRPVQGGRTRRLQAGDRMPHAVVAGEPSLWQRLKGTVPMYREGTVWELVGYGDGVEGEPQGSALQAMNATGAKDAAASATDVGKMARTNDDANPGADPAGSEKAPPSGDPA